MEELSYKYDRIGEYHQGVAIVLRNGKYGAIMVGGKEIVPPVYDALTEFKDGLAKAEFNGEERIVNLSGQIQVKKGEKLVFLPEKYDWGYDFEENVCIVIQIGYVKERYSTKYHYKAIIIPTTYGLLSDNFEELLDPSYDLFSPFNNGYAVFGKSSNLKGKAFKIVVNNRGKTIYNIHEECDNLFRIVSIPDEHHPTHYGIINQDFNEITSFDYDSIRQLNNSFFLGRKEKKHYVIDHDSRIVFVSENEEEIIIKDRCFLIKKWMEVRRIINFHGKELVCLERNEFFHDVKSVNQYFFVVHTNKDNCSLHYVISNSGETIIQGKGNLNAFFVSDFFYYRSSHGTLFRIDSKGNYQLLQIHWNNTHFSAEVVKQELDHLQGKIVPYDYLHYNFSLLSDGLMSVCDMEKGLYGLVDESGNLLINPKYGCLVQWNTNSYIVSLITEEDNSIVVHRFGIIDKSEKVLLPFDYAFLGILVPEKIIAYSLDAKISGRFISASVSKNHFLYGPPSFPEGLIGSDLSVICEPKYYKIERIETLDFFKVADNTGKWWGVIDYNGKVVIPIQYARIAKSNNPNAFFEVIGTEYSSTSRNNINAKGDFVVLINDKPQIVPSKKYDWCDNFNDAGWAKVTKNGFSGKININGKLISVFENKLFEVPDCYDWAYDFHYGFVSVNKGGKWGIANTNFDLVIPCKYEDIEAISTKRFKIRKGNKWGIIDKQSRTISSSEYESISHVAKKYFKVHIYIQECSFLAPRYGIIDENGHIIIPAEYKEINIASDGVHLFWIVDTGKKGVVNENGDEIIPPIYDNIKLSDGLFMCEIYKQCHSNPVTLKEIMFSNNYTINGEQRINIDKDIVIDIPKEYVIGSYVGFGLIRVINKDNKWGLINIMNEVIIEPQFTYIDTFDGTYATVWSSEVDEVILFIDGDQWHTNMKYGIINTCGDIILPMEYDSIEKWDNGYYYLIKKNGPNTLLSPTLHTIIESEKPLKKLSDRYILVIIPGEYPHSTKYGLIDYNGNEIVPTDQEHSFSEIEVLKNGFLKVIYDKGEYGSSHIGILNNHGDTILERKDCCDDITLLDNGFIIVKCKNHDYPTTYSLVNLQGKEILPDTYAYFEIKLLYDGTISFREQGGWGLADIQGNVIIEPNYLEELVFEDGVANINVKGSSLIQKINEKGIVIVHNGKNKIELPNSVYWGTDYVNGLSIVRRKGRGSHVVGVVDIKGKMIIPAQYKSVTLLSDNTIRVMDGDCYGLFDLKGRTILPPIFTDIYYIAEDRIIVEWNLNIVKEWDKMGYTPGNSYTKYKGSDGDLDYRACNRSALCNSKGEIINDKELLYVENFIGNYAKAYKKIEKGKIKLNTKIEVVEVDAIKYRQVGVIDLSGNIIVQPIYDSIVLYKDSLYVKVCKDEKYGIIHLPSKSIKMYDDVPIKHLWDVDALGRCVYSEDCEYDDDNDDWIGGTRGVLNPQGVLVPPGKYTDIYLIDNGLIKVSNDEGDLYGLLDKEGNEILPIKYTYISSFKGNYATICIGGETDYYSNRMIRGGKWGVIDNTGKFVKECISDDEEKLVNENVFNDNRTSNYHPSVILSDSISEPKERNSYDYGYDSYRDDDDEGPYSKYGGYNGWDDNTIDEAFDGNPELTWNID